MLWVLYSLGKLVLLFIVRLDVIFIEGGALGAIVGFVVCFRDIIRDVAFVIFFLALGVALRAAGVLFHSIGLSWLCTISFSTYYSF